MRTLYTPCVCMMTGIAGGGEGIQEDGWIKGGGRKALT